MKRKLLSAAIAAVFIALPFCVLAQEEAAAERILLLREAREHGDTIVAVEAYLSQNIMDVTIIARMYAKKPKIYNSVITGPKLGRLSPQAKQTLVSKVGEEYIFPVTDEGGIIRLTKRTEEKKIKGTMTKELVQFDIPADKIVPDRRYQLWIDIESLQSPGQYERFKFDLENLSESLSKSK